MELGFVTLFPTPVEAYLAASILGRACENGLIAARIENPRDYAYDPHRKVDDSPYGGHAGMLMRPEPVRLALAALLGQELNSRSDLPEGTAVVVTEPGGRRFDQSVAEELAACFRVVFVCGHYEGIDHRFEETFATHVLSLGDFVLTGGELPALVMADAVARRLPGVLGSSDSLDSDSFADGHEVSAPNYTRPPLWLGRAVPPVLQSGDHAAVARWREEVSRARTGLRPNVTRSHLLERLAYDAWANSLLFPLAKRAGGRAAEVAAHIRDSQRRWLERASGEGSWAEFVHRKPLEDRVLYVDSRGEAMDRSFADVVIHLTNHGTYHRGQLRALLEQAGVEFPNTDWIYWRDSGSPILDAPDMP